MENVLNSLVLSVHYRILHLLMQAGFVLPQTDVVLPLIPAGPAVAPNSYGLSGTHYPWVFLDNGFAIDDSLVKVYVGGALQGSSLYRVNYADGRVVFNAKPNGVVTADFTRYAAHVREAFNDVSGLIEFLTANELPLVTWHMDRQTGEAFSIGSNIENRRRYVSLVIYGNNTTEVRAYGDAICRRLVRCAMVDMVAAQPLGFGGYADYNWDYQKQAVSWLRFPIRPELYEIPVKPGESDKLRFQGKILLQIENVD